MCQGLQTKSLRYIYYYLFIYYLFRRPGPAGLHHLMIIIYLFIYYA